MIMLEDVWSHDKGERKSKTSLLKCCTRDSSALKEYLSMSKKFVGCPHLGAMSVESSGHREGLSEKSTGHWTPCTKELPSPSVCGMCLGNLLMGDIVRTGRG